ncbi:hypothetical protein ODS41_06620 [Pyrobaculum sp. 3827-6]|uniref:hypothetical protein n=1 Tax=Pyrobaculum sp. 3827-6 TaxID=2983604 RepID=UPI0021D870F1|nr:hypothetical protein [Pyrobaculum sp. 3827-6]MCU7787588.1 hypothetical protein [Pyrobaculum sp. 3827-6]
MDGKIEGVKAELGGRISELKGMVEELRRDVKSLGVAFYNYQNTLIDFLATKGFVSASEAVLLRGVLRTLTPMARSRYYTEEVRRRLLELLDKDVESYTWDEVAELERIAKAIYQEYIATGREDLLEYYPKLMVYITIIRGLIRRREMEKGQVQSKIEGCGQPQPK